MLPNGGEIFHVGKQMFPGEGEYYPWREGIFPGEGLVFTTKTRRDTKFFVSRRDVEDAECHQRNNSCHQRNNSCRRRNSTGNFNGLEYHSFHDVLKPSGGFFIFQ